MCFVFVNARRDHWRIDTSSLFLDRLSEDASSALPEHLLGRRRMSQPQRVDSIGLLI